MLTDLIVEGYQSLKQVTLRLGQFTVITGPTGSGKSSVIRAARLVGFNARGTSYITQGTSKCVVGLADEDEGWAVTITRAGRGEDSYVLSRLVPVPAGGKGPLGTKYTKLAGKVPDEVAEVVNLRPLNFAGQFDGPYLLTATAGDVAKALGLLTNVTLIFGAAREGARRKRGLEADLKAAEREVERLKAEAQRFTGLKDRLTAASSAEDALARVTETSAQADRLRAAITRYSAAQGILAQVVLPPEPPDLTAAEQAAERVRRLRWLIDAARQQQRLAGEGATQVTAAGQAVADLERQAHDELVSAGTCPLCGQVVAAAGGAHDGGARERRQPAG